MSKARQDHNSGPASPSVLQEYRLWEEHWIRSVAKYRLINNILSAKVTHVLKISLMKYFHSIFAISCTTDHKWS